MISAVVTAILSLRFLWVDLLLLFLIQFEDHELWSNNKKKSSSYKTFNNDDTTMSTTTTTSHVLVGCQGKNSGDSFSCSCSTGMIHVMDNDKTLVFNQCYDGIINGALNGVQGIDLENDTMGLAVYSPFSRNLCDPQDNCICTCFDKESVQGNQASFHTKSPQFEDGLISDCLGLCGPQCALGVNVTTRFANILIHDVCQSFIRSIEPMPNRNNCSDEGWAALSGAILTVMRHGSCPFRV